MKTNSERTRRIVYSSVVGAIGLVVILMAIALHNKAEVQSPASASNQDSTLLGQPTQEKFVPDYGVGGL
jgi:hypothetical protein